jgi:geranylgeranyl pyrophosphate synthase
MFEHYHKGAKLYGGSEHFGVAMGLHVGLAGTYLVATELGRLDVADDIKVAATNNLNQAIYTTVHGQFNDIANEAVRLVNEKQVERTLTWKAAYYTFLQPLQLGLLLAGSEDVNVPAVRTYAMNLGLAFQITDDILGTFGDAATGKSNREDIIEGKITLLVSRALQRSNADQKKVLLVALGNRDLTDEVYENVKFIMRKTGALDYVREIAMAHAQVAVKALDTTPKTWDKQGVQFLRELASFIVLRKA